jgi:hypothetical protein
MEWTVPLQRLEVGKVNVGSVRYGDKPMAPLAYFDGPIHMQSMNILLPPLVVKEYDPTTGRLKLSLTDMTQTATKLSALQDTLLNLVFTKQSSWFPGSRRTASDLQALFQPFVENQSLHLYCPSNLTGSSGISFRKHNEWKKGVDPRSIQKGDLLRVAFRIQGISFQQNTEQDLWTGRFRLQHKILYIFHCSTT